MNVTERILCNTCDQWAPPPYRKGRCPRCTGASIGDLRVCCGDCDQYPCACPHVDDIDLFIVARTTAGQIMKVA